MNLIKFDTNKIIDISMPIYENMKVYKGRDAKKPRIENQVNHKTTTVHESLLSMNLHTGTHIDTKLHMIDGGEVLENLSISDFIAPAIVLDFSNLEDSIGKDDLEKKFQEKNLEDKNLEDYFLLLKTKNSFEDILEKDFIFLNETGAKFLAEKNLRGVGIDALGIERDQAGHTTHLLLMGKNIHILEGLQLEHVKEGEYTLLALPLSILGVEASPVRAVLFPIEK